MRAVWEVANPCPLEIAVELARLVGQENVHVTLRIVETEVTREKIEMIERISAEAGLVLVRVEEES